MIAAGGTGLGYSATSNEVEVDKLLLNYAMIHFFYGALCGLFTYVSLLYDACCTDRSERLGCANMVDCHFSGVKLQITLSGKSSFFGALILLIQSMTKKNPVALVMAEWLLGMSGFLTGSKVTGVFAKMSRPVCVVEELPDSVAADSAADQASGVSRPLQSIAQASDHGSNEPYEQIDAVAGSTSSATQTAAVIQATERVGSPRFRGNIHPSTPVVVLEQWTRADQVLRTMHPSI